ncbi:MAG: glutamate racemase [Spirochaetes bacterium]|nr:glutamate racemase [Spirochaetota bacterium]
MNARTEQNNKPRKIGVIDSGVGGMTVVREIARLLPDADIIYFGDSANVPYGNRTEAEIIDLTCAMLDFMRGKDVALVAVACNTISTVIDKFQSRYNFPIFSIIGPAAAHVAASDLHHVGLLATEFTIKTGQYQKLIHERNASITIHAKGSKNLAALLEAPEYDEAAVDEEISSLLSALAKEYPVKYIILGCTHYPIAIKLFNKRAPDIHFIDPAALQAEEVRHFLESQGYSSYRNSGSLSMYTSGDTESFTRILEVLGIQMPHQIHAAEK